MQNDYKSLGLFSQQSLCKVDQEYNVGMVHKRRLSKRKLHGNCPTQNNNEKSKIELARAWKISQTM